MGPAVGIDPGMAEAPGCRGTPAAARGFCMGPAVGIAPGRVILGCMTGMAAPTAGWAALGIITIITSRHGAEIGAECPRGPRSRHGHRAGSRGGGGGGLGDLSGFGEDGRLGYWGGLWSEGCRSERGSWGG